MGGPGFCNGKTYNIFDNFYSCVFFLDGKKYCSSEQCYQSLKFVDENYKEKIRLTFSPNSAWSLGQSREYELIPNFEQEKVNLMYKANYAKFNCNPELAEVLINTGNYPISFVGSTPFWNRANSTILEKIRNELKKEINGK